MPRQRLARDAVKTASPAQPGRSEAQRLDGVEASRTIESDGPASPTRTYNAVVDAGRAVLLPLKITAFS